MSRHPLAEADTILTSCCTKDHWFSRLLDSGEILYTVFLIQIWLSFSLMHSRSFDLVDIEHIAKFSFRPLTFFRWNPCQPNTILHPHDSTLVTTTEYYFLFSFFHQQLTFIVSGKPGLINDCRVACQSERNLCPAQVAKRGGDNQQMVETQLYPLHQEEAFVAQHQHLNNSP